MVTRTEESLAALVGELRRLPGETAWVEFRSGGSSAPEIGESISALANAAAVAERPFAYLAWGISKADLAVEGTDFRPAAQRVGNETLQAWLSRLLTPRTPFRFCEGPVDGKSVVLLEIAAADRQPVYFQDEKYIVENSRWRRLGDCPERERELWRSFERAQFETRAAAEGLAAEEVLVRLNWPAFFTLFRQPPPVDRASILDKFESEGLIRRSDGEGWDVTNLGAILFANDLTDFDHLGRKGPRVIQYGGPDPFSALREKEETRGYAVGFDRVMEWIDIMLPSREEIRGGLRKTIRDFPEAAVRELVANAMTHQDFTRTGTSLMVQIFDGRVEITNPGAPLIASGRFVDAPPRSRNEALASFMRRAAGGGRPGPAERGQGWDNVIEQIEERRLPAPRIDVYDYATRVTLFGPSSLADMMRIQQAQTVYLHACLRRVRGGCLTHASVRSRFGLEKNGNGMTSRLIEQAVEEELIVPSEDGDGTGYVPWWAYSQHLGDGPA